MDINLIIKSFCNSFCIFYIFIKIFNYTSIKLFKNKIVLFLGIILFSIIYVVFRKYMNLMDLLLVYIFLQTIFLRLFTQKNIFNTLIGVVISNATNYIVFILSTIIEYIFCKLLNFDNNVIEYIVLSIFQVGIVLCIFKLKQLKKGLYFLQKEDDYLNMVIASISSFLILLYCLIGSYFGSIEKKILECFAIISCFMIFTIQKLIKLSYKHKIIERTLKEYEEELKQKELEIEKISNEKFQISKLNHEFHHRQEALLLKVENTLNDMKYEGAIESDLSGKIKELSREYTGKLETIKNEFNLPKTEVTEIDDMFTYMASECKKNNIEFILQINGNINYLVNNLIDKKRLETLIGDHLRDSIIAINCSENKYRSLLTILGIKDDNYELCIYDSGIEFEIETFEKLGIEPATTHKESGGTGIGFITTFETLKETNASFIIEELNDNNYTKAVRFIFDGKSRLEIKSYRANDIIKKINSKRFKIYD